MAVGGEGRAMHIEKFGLGQPTHMLDHMSLCLLMLPRKRFKHLHNNIAPLGTERSPGHRFGPSGVGRGQWTTGWQVTGDLQVICPPSSSSVVCSVWPGFGTAAQEYATDSTRNRVSLAKPSST